jgi:hypothetical protein
MRLLYLWALVVCSGLNHVSFNKKTFTTDIQMYLHHDNSEYKLYKLDSLLKYLVDTSKGRYFNLQTPRL